MAIHHIGILDRIPLGGRGNEMLALFDGLKKTLSSGDEVITTHAWASDPNDLADLAKELFKHVRVVVACGGTWCAKKAKEEADKQLVADAGGPKAIVFTTVSNPNGIVNPAPSDGRRNATGVVEVTAALDDERLKELRDITGAIKIGVLFNDKRPNPTKYQDELKTKADEIGAVLTFKFASTPAEINAKLMEFAENSAVLVASDPFLYSQRHIIVPTANARRLRSMYQWRAFVEAGGWASYGQSIDKAYKQAGIYTAEILKGKHPDQLPIMTLTDEPMRFMSRRASQILDVEIPSNYTELP